MNDHWSLYVQTSEELYRSRALRFHDGNKDLWLKAIGAKDNMDILEIGCGGGVFCHRLKQYLPNARVTGLDFDTGHIAWARQKSAELGIGCAFVNGDALDLPFADESFDLCFSHTVMEHIPTEPFLAEQRRVLRKGTDGALGGRIAVLSVRMKYSMPDFSQAGAGGEERALSKKLWDAAEGKCPRENIGAYELSESDYPRKLEEAGFHNVHADFFAVTYYAPDCAGTPREMALEQIGGERLDCTTGVEKAARMAPDALTPGEQRRLLQLMGERFDLRVAQYERGEKQWDMCARMVLCASGAK